MGIELENKKRSNNEFLSKISELSSKKIELEQKIKEISKQPTHISPHLLTFKPKFVDDYEK